MNTPTSPASWPENEIIGRIILSESEQKLVGALIGLSLATNVSVIARKAGLPRTTTFYLLRKFVKAKIARSIKRGKRTHYMFNRMKNRVQIKVNLT